MPDASDRELLADYVRNGSEDAFATVVQRHVNLVYSVALRHVGIPAQAEEITQAVFVVLSRKAAVLHPNTILEGWLYETTRLTSLSFMRTERRRQFREQEAYMQSQVQDSHVDSVWNQLAPLLDDAVARLGKKDRDAVTLRFFKEKSLREVAATLQVSEAAAQRRVLRALEKLRGLFAKRGLGLTTVGIAAAISANSIQAAPVGLAKMATAVALAKGTTASGSTLALIKGALQLMAWTKAKTLALGIVTLLVLCAGTGFVIFEATHTTSIAAKPEDNPVADQSTPKGTLLLMSQAMETADAKAYVDCFAFVTPDDSRLQGVLERLVTANAKFKQALSHNFGSEAANAAFSNLPLVIPAELIQSAKELIDGDTATVTFPGSKGGRPVQFRKSDGKWKMAADGFWHLSSAAMSDILGRAVKALDEVALEIPQNKFKTAMDAVDSMKERAR